jgi:hypothetical protein
VSSAGGRDLIASTVPSIVTVNSSSGRNAATSMASRKPFCRCRLPSADPEWYDGTIGMGQPRHSEMPRPMIHSSSSSVKGKFLVDCSIVSVQPCAFDVRVLGESRAGRGSLLSRCGPEYRQ